MPKRVPRTTDDGKALQGRPRIELTADEVRQSGQMAAYALNTEKIAHILGIHPRVFFLRLAEDKEKFENGDRSETNLFFSLAKGRSAADAAIARSLFKQATSEASPNITAAIFLAKVRLGWRDTDTLEIVGADGHPVTVDISVGAIAKLVQKKLKEGADLEFD